MKRDILNQSKLILKFGNLRVFKAFDIQMIVVVFNLYKLFKVYKSFKFFKALTENYVFYGNNFSENLILGAKL